ncbi:MAG: alkaline phosphatase family protein [Phycisphaeraceae bacterium]|nr:alkaline phosphatase family protein [Phycisphaeraceae bacterium]
MRRLAVLNIVGLTQAVLAHAPGLSGRAAKGMLRALRPPLPAVTCTAQATMLTGRPPAGHGIVGNGWYDRESAEVRFWKQSGRLVAGDKVWDVARRRDPAFTCAQLFWWFNMHANVDVAVTPRPLYLADGRKIPDIHTRPASLRDDLTAALGAFPLFRFWGPGAGLASSTWIARSAAHVVRTAAPTLTLVYLPHLDYAAQQYGPDDPRTIAEIGAIDRVASDLASFLESEGVDVMIVSEYGLEAVDAPVRINRILRTMGLLAVRDERGRDHLDPGESRAFAIADHQVAHVCINPPAPRASATDPARLAAELAGVEGIAEVLLGEARAARGLDHPRAGDLVLVASPGRWFSYDWWLDDARAPDYARTVDIHRKPGYDPLELFVDPRIRLPRLRIAAMLAARRLGHRMPLSIIPLDPALVRGSHGRDHVRAEAAPVLILPPGSAAGAIADEADAGVLPMARVHDAILAHVFSA